MYYLDTSVLAASAPLKTLDALHLAIASEGNLTLLTSDQWMGRCAKHFGVDFIKIEAE
jgi:predicted nucleic acid-binding protein